MSPQMIEELFILHEQRDFLYGNDRIKNHMGHFPDFLYLLKAESNWNWGYSYIL